jgi:DNA ligase-1
MIGAIKCQLNNGKIFKIGSGFTKEERKNPPKIGSIVTFKYKEFTKNAVPRFSVFMRVRDSK